MSNTNDSFLAEDFANTVQTAERLTFRTFSEANRARCESPQGFNHPLSAWSTSDWMTALVGEVGEAANIVKKLNRVRDGIPGNKKTPDELRTDLRRELGDVFVYLDLMAQSLGFYIDDAAVEVFDAKSNEIGYPCILNLAALDIASERAQQSGEAFDAFLAGLGDQQAATAEPTEADVERVAKAIAEDLWVGADPKTGTMAVYREDGKTLEILQTGFKDATAASEAIPLIRARAAIAAMRKP